MDYGKKAALCWGEGGGGAALLGNSREVGGNSHIETDRIQLPLHQGDPR